MSGKAGRRGEQSDYQSYLLRLWRVNDGEEGWRASLESAQADVRTGFANLEALFTFLRQQTTLLSVADLEEDEGGSEEGKERRWLSSSVYRRPVQRKHRWFAIFKCEKERKR